MPTIWIGKTPLSAHFHENAFAPLKNEPEENNKKEDKPQKFPLLNSSVTATTKYCCDQIYQLRF